MLDKKFLEDLLIKLKKIQATRGGHRVFFNGDPLEDQSEIYIDFGAAEQEIFNQMRKEAWRNIYGGSRNAGKTQFTDAQREYAKRDTYYNAYGGKDWGKADPFKDWVMTKIPTPQKWHPTNVVEMSFINDTYVESVKHY